MSYLHIGGEIDLRAEEVVCICDMDNATWSYLTRATLRTAEEEGRVFNAAEDLPRSFIRCADGSIYLSGLSAATLQRRAENEIYE